MAGLVALRCRAAVGPVIMDERLQSLKVGEVTLRYRDLGARIAGASLTLISDAGHFVMEESPEQVLPALNEWLATATIDEQRSTEPVT